MTDTAARLAGLAWSARAAQALASCRPPDPEAREGRVVRVEKGHARVGIGGDDEVLVTINPSMTADGPPAVGDWIWIASGEGPDGWSVAEVAPRWSRLARATPEAVSPVQVLAADLDVVCLVCGVDRPVREGRVERMLAATHESGAEPLAVVTKADLGDPSVAIEALTRVGLGLEVVVTSATDGAGVADLASHFAPDRTGVLLGESGAGKSSLVNVLLGEQLLAVGEVRTGDSKGRHTTTHRQLVALPGGGALIDTPGVRAFAVWDVSEGLGRTYAEIAELAEQCRFRNCRHEAEPGCAVKAGVDAGEVDAERFERYLELRDEHEAAEVRATEAARRPRGRRRR